MIGMIRASCEKWNERAFSASRSMEGTKQWPVEACDGHGGLRRTVDGVIIVDLPIALLPLGWSAEGGC